MTQLDLYYHLAQALQTGAIALATVIGSRGSVPREVGAKMLVFPDGHTWHTIGGGAGEAKVIRAAVTVLSTGVKQRVDIDLSGAPHRETQGICGGQMQVWLEKWEGDRAIALVQQIIQALQAGRPMTLVTPFDAERSPYLEATHLTNASCQITASAFYEPLHPPPALLIVGAGHCGIQLAKVADLLGFQVLVQDDRPEWANSNHYPQATQIFTQPIADVAAQLAHHTHLYAALVTRGYQYDLEALNVLLTRPHPCAYIGMIGSERRVRQVFQAIARTGISPAALSTIYAPIGLDIGALSPAEIAVSIGAELVLVQRGGTGKPLSDPLRQTLLATAYPPT